MPRQWLVVRVYQYPMRHSCPVLNGYSNGYENGSGTQIPHCREWRLCPIALSCNALHQCPCAPMDYVLTYPYAPCVRTRNALSPNAFHVCPCASTILVYRMPYPPCIPCPMYIPPRVPYAVIRCYTRHLRYPYANALVPHSDTYPYAPCALCVPCL
jgi:hypothetical protein